MSVRPTDTQHINENITKEKVRKQNSMKFRLIQNLLAFGAKAGIVKCARIIWVEIMRDKVESKLLKPLTRWIKKRETGQLEGGYSRRGLVYRNRSAANP